MVCLIMLRFRQSLSCGGPLQAGVLLELTAVWMAKWRARMAEAAVAAVTCPQAKGRPTGRSGAKRASLMGGPRQAR
jgi:hypothetical protein